MQKIISNFLLVLTILNFALVNESFAKERDSQKWRSHWPENEKLIITKISDSITMIDGVGGTSAVFLGSDGALIVDSGHPRILEKRMFPTVNKIIGDNNVRYIINTHSHGDHAAGNEFYAQRGATVISHDIARKELSNLPSHYKKMSIEGLPTITFQEKMTLHFNGQTIILYHAPFGHTRGDAIVHFKEQNVIHTGDLFIPHAYVVIAGMYKNPKGSTRGIIKEQEMVLALGNENTKFITGHARGIVATKKDLERDHNVLTTMTERVQKGIDNGLSLEQIKASKPGREFDDSFSWPGMTPSRTVDLIYFGLVGGAPDSKRRHED